MTKERYEKLARPFREHPGALKALVGLNRFLTSVYYALYIVLLANLLWFQDARLLRCILVPGIAFVVLSIYRDRRNAPRPYESGIDSLMKKNTKGHSFPSRQVFSAFMIAMTYFYIVPWLGALLILGGVALALVRVIGGVHYPKDVVIGALSGIAAGLIGFWLIP